MNVAKLLTQRQNKMKQHPIIKQLYCNESGTELTYKGKVLNISYTLRNGKKESGTVYINSIKRSVATVICECYNGMREDKSFFPVRKDGNASNNHPKNLSWGKRRGAVKIGEKEKKELYKAFAAGADVKELAKQYKVSPQTIRGYRKKYIESLPVIDAEIIN
jgi:hypothetical protein